MWVLACKLITALGLQPCCIGPVLLWAGAWLFCISMLPMCLEQGLLLSELRLYAGLIHAFNVPSAPIAI